MSTFTPKLEILPAAQRALWPLLSATGTMGLVLYGGTAVGLRLGHRPSIDFDFFTSNPLNRVEISAACPFVIGAKVLLDEPDAFTMLTGAPYPPGVKVSFFGGIDFGRVETPELTSDGVTEVASFADLMATKLKVILQRIEWKDYADLAAMIGARLDLSRGLSAARTLFAPSFQPSESLKALTYFEGGDLAQLCESDRETLVDAARAVRELPAVPRLSYSLHSAETRSKFGPIR